MGCKEDVDTVSPHENPELQRDVDREYLTGQTRDSDSHNTEYSLLYACEDALRTGWIKLRRPCVWSRGSNKGSTALRCMNERLKPSWAELDASGGRSVAWSTQLAPNNPSYCCLWVVRR